MKKYFSSYWIRSAFYSFLQRFSLTFFGFINFIVLIRWLTQAQMGVWALFLAVTSIFEATKSGLLKNAHIKYVSVSDDENEKAEIASASFIINSAISALFIICLLLLSGYLGVWLHTGPELAYMLKWFIPGLICMVFFSHFEAIQQSFLDFKGVFAGYLVRQLVFFVAIVSHALFHIPFLLWHLALYMSASIFLGTIVLYVYSRKYLLHRFVFSVKWIKRIVAYGGYIFGSGVMSNICANIDQVMTATFMSSSAVACYNAASRINALVDIPSYAAAEILFPKSARAVVEEGENKVKYLYEKMVGILISFTMPAAVIIILFPHLIIQLIAGEKYLAAAPILQMYMVTGLMRPMQNQAANLLNSIGKARLCFIINTIGVIEYLGVNYVCLSRMGFYGAAIGSVIMCVIGAVTWYFVMRRQIGLQMRNVFRYMMAFYKQLYTSATGFRVKQKSVLAR